MFTAEDIRDRVRKQPFVPLRITTSSGESFEVYHPEMMLVGRRDVQIGMPGPDDPTIYEQVTRVAILHITAIHDLSTRKRRDGNGRRRGQTGP